MRCWGLKMHVAVETTKIRSEKHCEEHRSSLELEQRFRSTAPQDPSLIIPHRQARLHPESTDTIHCRNSIMLCCIQVTSPDQRVPGLYTKLRRSLAFAFASASASGYDEIFLPSPFANLKCNPLNASIRASFVSCREREKRRIKENSSLVLLVCEDRLDHVCRFALVLPIFHRADGGSATTHPCSSARPS